MNNNFLITTALITVISSPLAFADQIINDDLIVTTPVIPVAGNTGKMCAGMDCFNGQVFGSATLLHKENNTRFRFIDNTAGDVLGQSWMMIANGSNNGGNAYFQFQARSLTEDNILFSDGTYPVLDCSAATIFDPCITTTDFILIFIFTSFLVSEVSHIPTHQTHVSKETSNRKQIPPRYH